MWPLEDKNHMTEADEHQHLNKELPSTYTHVHLLQNEAIKTGITDH